MLFVVKILFVAFAVLGQAKLFQEKPAIPAVEGGLDSLVLPADKPELVLAKRAMEAHGLCPTDPARQAPAVIDASDRSDEDGDTSNHVASICF